MAKKYYKKIKNQNYDAELLRIADSAVSGRGDGQISVDDAEKILWAVKDAGEYTDIEKKTIHYIRDNYKFTKKADTWFRKEIRSWAAKKTLAKKDKKALVQKPKKSKELVTEEFYSEPDNTYYEAQRALQTKKKEKHNNKFFILVSLGVLILFSIVYFLFPVIRNRIGKNKEAQNSTNNKDSNRDLQFKKQESQEISESKKQEIEVKKTTFPSLEKIKTVDGMTPEIISSESLIFDYSELYVNKKNRAFLRKVASFMKENENVKLKIIGHTCDKGTEEDNLKLSIERAESVAKYLKLQKVDSTRIIVSGEGEKKPIADNSKKEGQEMNRRVQLEIVSN